VGGGGWGGIAGRILRCYCTKCVGRICRREKTLGYVVVVGTSANKLHAERERECELSNSGSGLATPRSVQANARIELKNSGESTP
jgi:hypothetical protein